MSAPWRTVRRLFGASLLAVSCWPSAAAEIWGYVDAQGVAHFATEKVDERYELFFRTGVDSSAPAAPEAAPAPAEALVLTPAAPRSSGMALRMNAFFAGSPTYRAVQKHLLEASTTHGIDYELLKALIVAESGFNAQAVSPKGAVGLMQLMPATAERYGVASDKKAAVEQKLTDPKTNIRAGSRYLRYLINLFPGRLDLALAAYNAGEGAVQRAGNRIPNYRETQNYVRTVMELYTALKPEEPVRVEARNSPPGRVRMVMGGPPVGGAALRGNMPQALTDPLQPSRPSEPSRPSAPSGPSAPLGAMVPSGTSGPSGPAGPASPSGPSGPNSSLVPAAFPQPGATVTLLAAAPRDGAAAD